MIVASGATAALVGGGVGLGVWDFVPVPPLPPVWLDVLFVPLATIAPTTISTTSPMTEPPAMNQPLLLRRGETGPPGCQPGCHPG
jgi:hypothetical protein